MKILVTGGTGFVGSNIVRALLAEGHEVFITGSDAEQKIPGFKGKYLQPGLLGIDWDEIGNIDAVFHEAAINDTTHDDTREMMRANLESSRALFEYAAMHECRHIVYASSTAVYGDVFPPFREDSPTHPLNPYAESKLALDVYAQEFARMHPEIIVVGLRYCNVYGPGESHKGKRASMIYQLAQQMQKRAPVLFKDGEQKRDYVYIKDVITANLKALATTKSCVVNCGSGAATSFNELVRILNGVLDMNLVPEYIENPYERTYQKYTLCDMSRAKELLGFVPQYDIEDGIRDYYASGLCDSRP
ncbi:MAG: NAD-dependent epimerase/dehydratase family protein [Patescibacteria group bacterium]|nr:NAD-dependent epimerase/dehydratase family protein [Patescibacteria group bacterium]